MTRTAVVGAGPTGLFLAMALAHRGHQVTVIDRDAGPNGNAPGDWDRKGVMQFHHPHFFRPQVRDALVAEAPGVDEALVAAGAIHTPVVEVLPDFKGYRVRRSMFEKVLREAAAKTDGITMVTGHADRVAAAGGRAVGVEVGASTVDADLVIDASGRNGRFADDLRAPAVGGDCGFAYVSRYYKLNDGADFGPQNAPPGWGGVYDGYLVILFAQDNGLFQALFVRPSVDDELARLRDVAVYDTAAAAVPSISAWIQNATPYTPPMAGGGLNNTYRGQLTENGAVALPGVVFVGDSVLTTNPAAGRGVTTSIMQARRFLELLDENGGDYEAIALAFDAWCDEHMRAWWQDHTAWDAGLLSRWRGEPIDLDTPLPSDLICSLAEIDPSALQFVGPYMGMFAGPSVLKPIEERAREALRAGHRPAVPDGPSRDELVALFD